MTGNSPEANLPTNTHPRVVLDFDSGEVLDPQDAGPFESEHVRASSSGTPPTKHSARAPAVRVYEILVQEAGAAPSSQWESSFVDWFNKATDPDEWRFSGWLGFGGKFWRNRGKLYVTCYREDETPERLEIIQRTNKRLADLL